MIIIQEYACFDFIIIKDAMKKAGFPQKFKNTIPGFFHDFSMINNVISMTIQCTPWPPTSAVIVASLFLQCAEFKCGMQQQ